MVAALPAPLLSLLSLFSINYGFDECDREFRISFFLFYVKPGFKQGSL